MWFIAINQRGDHMKNIELAAIQERFADVVWANEPIASGDLVKVCEKELNWKKPTTYTVLRKLCEKGLLQNVDGTVSSLVSKDDFYAAKSEQIIEDSYKGSLPSFIAAFTANKKLSKDEVEEIQRMIDAFKEEG
jgi:predicted transcriptional regulator